ncbi:MAG: hypothetical protein ACI9UA_000824 [Pseudoalteromonas tetraodonis]
MKKLSQIQILLAAIALMVGMIGFAQAQGRSEESMLLSATQKALAEARTATIEAQAQIKKLQKQTKNLGKSLAEANRLANEFRSEYSKLRLETEALGIETFTEGEKGMSKRLLSAVSDHRIMEGEREAMAHALLDLSDAVKSYMTTAVSNNVETRTALQVALNNASDAIGLNRKAPIGRVKKQLNEAKVISLKREYGILILNVGEMDDANIGMNFDIFRKDRIIGSAMIVDVRDSRSGAVITKLIDESDDAQVGDRVRIRTQKNL